MKNSLEAVHKSIYQYLKNKAETLEGKPSLQLQSYKRDQHKSSIRKFSNSNIKQLSSSLEDSDIVYLGDFHTFDQATRNLERIIRIVSSSKSEYAIGLEFVHVSHQKYINYFIQGHITELEFLESINYKESWRFPWTFYKRFFELAKQQRISVIALNTRGSLKSRDHKAAQTIAKHYKENPQRKLLVLFGEYHIVEDKLPARVLRATNKSVIQTIIHQNLDEVYWKLFKNKKLKKDSIVKFNSREFVLTTSAPWLKYESQIYWYEHLNEDPEFDIHEYIIETGSMNFSDNVPDNFAYICDEFVKTYRIDIPTQEIEDFHLYDHIKLSNVQKKITKYDTTRMQNFFINLIKRGRSFRLADHGHYFCPNYSTNRISYLAGIHAHSIKLDSLGFNARELVFGRNRDQIFVYYLFQSMSGYLASKLINPYRKCDLYQNYKDHIRSRKTKKSKKELYKVGLKLTDEDQDISKQIKGIQMVGLYNLARMLGHMYGDILFDHFFVLERYEFREAIDIIFSRDFSDSSFTRLKDILLSELDYKEFNKRVF